MSTIAEIAPIGPLATQISFLVIAIGFYWFVHHAWKRREGSFRLKTFFLGGGKVGPDLTEHTTLGNTFAWSGGTWFFATVGYVFGPWVTLTQIPWCISIVILGLLFAPIQKATRNRTIHGYLDVCFGAKVRVIACIATTLGYIFNAGFELFWSGRLFAISYGQPGLKLLVAFSLAVLTAIYCGIGGFKANASTDKPQNLLGVFSLTALALFTAYSTTSDALRFAALLFSAGSVFYIVISLSTKPIQTDREARFHSIFAVSIALVAIIATTWLVHTGSSADTTSVARKLLGSSAFPWHLMLGLVVFQLFFNLIDMANWQSIAANGDIPESECRRMGWAFIRSALYLNWFPAFGGTIVGLSLRALSTQITDDNIFQAAFSTVLPGGGDLFRGLVLGILLLGFLSTTLSTADSYLMAAAQTLCYDLFYHKRVRALLDGPTEQIEEERKLVMSARRILLPLAIVMVLVFWQAYERYNAIGGNALDFQFIMYAFAISLFAPVVYALRSGERDIYKYRKAAFAAIAVGIVTAVVPYSITLLLHLDADHRAPFVNLTPIFSLLLSSLVFIAGMKITSIVRGKIVN
jgi:Na+/pantothenate symporter